LLLGALVCAKLGWPVLMLRPRDKRPATKHGFKDATTDRGAVVRSWTLNPDANVGVATGEASGLAAVDVDPRNGGDDSLHEWQRLHGDLPETLAADTGGGGVHFFFQLPEGGLPSGELVPGIDLKAEGGYVVVAPSVHPSGGTYAWRGDPATTPIAELPEAIVLAMRNRASRRAAGIKGVPEPKAPVGTDAKDSLLGRKFEALGLLGEAKADGTRRVVCLWQDSHTTGGPLDSSTVLFPATLPGGPGLFYCSHSHCLGKTKAEVVQELERRLALASPERAWMVELRRTEKGAVKCTFANVVLILTHDATYGAKLRLDEMRGVVMLGDVEITDAAISRMRVAFEQRYAIQPGDSEMARAVQLVASTNGFHPVGAWLRQLKWDGVPRLEQVATEILRVRAESDDELTLFALLVRRWCISLVARALSPGCKVDTALILEGAQGAGKSSFFRVIAGEWFSDTEMALDKDAMLQLRGAWVYEWSELENVTSRQSVSRVKAFMTSTEDRYRPPFGRNPVNVKRSGVIVGTTNTQDFLHDPSGSRRFWVIPVGGIDIARLRQLREQLVAEAVAAYETGERYWLSEDEEARREALAMRFVEVDPWEERVLEFAAAQERVRVADVLLQALAVPIDRMAKRDQMRVAAILRRAAYRDEQSRIDGKVTRYWVRPTGKRGRDGGDGG
jgi:predicted P-loop ATPase